MVAWTIADIPDLTDRVVVVTGANSGIGLETTIGLASAGATVIMACRSEQRGEAARSELSAPVRDRTEVMALDLTSGPSIEHFATLVAARHPHLDLLVNNAGVMAPSPEPTAALADTGDHDRLAIFDRQWATNHLGPFALTGRLLPLLIERPSRIVTVSSLAAGYGDPNRMIRSDGTLPSRGRFGRGPAGRFAIYGDTKWANQVFALELNHRLAAIDSMAISLIAHPGVAHTNLATGIRLPGPATRALLALSHRFTQPAADGALPVLRAATDPAAEGGQYYGPEGRRGHRGAPKQIPVVAGTANRTHGRELWERSMALTGVRFLTA